MSMAKNENGAIRPIWLVLFGIAMAVLFVVAFVVASRGADVGQIPPDVPGYVRDWFKAVKSPNGIPCCDIADGHRTAWRYAPNGVDYEVLDPREDHAGQWLPVPPEAVIRNTGNPVGEAVVWYSQPLYIRCFVPENEV